MTSPCGSSTCSSSSPDSPRLGSEKYSAASVKFVRTDELLDEVAPDAPVPCVGGSGPLPPPSPTNVLNL